ncbi:MAG: hypothetical protein AAF682_07640 [Planctomycetota bacterium]
MQHERKPSSTSLGVQAVRAASALALLAAVASAQRSEAELKSDISFARGLAAEWQYVDLAEEVILDIEGSGGLGKDVAEELGLVKCEIYAEGAKREANPDVRDELYAKAVEAFRGYIDKNPVSDYLPQAERGYVDVSNLYSRNLEKRYQEAIGEEADTLRAKTTELLEEALKRTSELAEALKSNEWTLAEKLEWSRVMFNRGQMYHTMGRVSDEGAFFFSQAESALEDLAGKMGEKTPQGLFAYLELAGVYASQNRHDDAAAFGEFVVDTVLPVSAKVRNDGGWKDLTAEEKAKRWTFVERGTGPVVEAYSNAGYPEDASKWALHFYNSWKREGFNLSPSGHLSLLAVARTLLDTGGFIGGSTSAGSLRWFETAEDMDSAGVAKRDRRASIDLALSIAQTVNNENKGNTLQIRAQKLISDVIGRPGVQVSPDVLYEAALGEYYNKNYPTALESFRRVMRSLDGQDQAVRLEYGAKVLYHIGESLRKQDRALEAALAYKEGATTYRGDPEFDEKNAKGYYGTAGELRSKASGVAEFDTMRRDAENLMTQISKDTDDIVFRQAKRIYDQDDYPSARDKFLEVQKGADIYEKSLAYAALCLKKLKDNDAAEKEFQNYVGPYVSDAKNQVTTPKAVATRREAMAMSHYYLGSIAYERANKGQGSYDEVVARLGNYHDEYPDQTSYAPNALYMVMMSQLAKKDVDAVKTTHAKMVELFPTNKFTGSGAYKVYKVLAVDRKAAEEAGDTETAGTIAQDMATFMRLGNSLAGSPSFPNLRVESSLWIDVENHTEAERVLNAILERFGDDAAQTEVIEKHVKPDLGEVLLAQKRAQDAFDLLSPLVPDPDDDEDPRKPSSRVVMAYCHSIAGWVLQEGKTITPVPGVGGAENLSKACKYWVQLTKAVERESKWEDPWYERKFETAFAYYQWGLVDSEKMGSARSQIQTLRTELGNELQDLENDEIRERFLWLWKKVQ